MAEFNVPEVNASGEFVSPLVKSHVQKLALSVSGPGRPDQVATTQGAITGSEPVGTTYTSTDGANVGAYVWRKRPGGKWEVTDGDTGWRNISSLMTAYTSGVTQVRRINSTIYWRFGFRGSPDTGSSLPDSDVPGFKYPAAQGVYPEQIVTQWSQRDRNAAAGTITYKTWQKHLLFGVVSDEARAEFSRPTTEAWPTTLPGTPA